MKKEYISGFLRRFAPNGNPIRIPTKRLDILLHPPHGNALITQRQIGISFGLILQSVSIKSHVHRCNISPSLPRNQGIQTPTIGS
jgi:hypothetical protein